MHWSNERRSEPRVRVQVRLTLTDPVTGKKHSLQTTNLSAAGACCHGAGMPSWDGEAEGVLHLPVTEGRRDVDVGLPVRIRLLRREERCDGETLALALEMEEEDRAELRTLLLDWLAADTCTQGHLVGADA